MRTTKLESTTGTFASWFPDLNYKRGYKIAGITFGFHYEDRYDAALFQCKTDWALGLSWREFHLWLFRGSLYQQVFPGTDWTTIIRAWIDVPHDP